MRASSDLSRRAVPAGDEDRQAGSATWRPHALALLFYIALFTVFFAPVVFSGRQLAPGDAEVFYLPHYRVPPSLWNPDSMTGFPETADPQVMTWYLPAMLLSRLGMPWNIFLILAYVLAAWFTYLYLNALTGQKYAALAGGVVFSLSGFMVSHLGHTAMIHTAAWIPGLLWVLEEMAQEFRVRWVLIGGFIGSQCVLAGHPQIMLYGAALAGAYVVFRICVLDGYRARYFVGAAAMALLALTLSAPQLMATKEFAPMTLRARLSFEAFGSYSLSPFQLATLVFPCLFGGAGASFVDHIPFFAAGGPTETAGFAGFAAAELAVIALLGKKRRSFAGFWIASCTLALLAAMGGSTPMGKILYHLPGFGMFRAQGRFVVIIGLAMAVLAGCGIATLLEKQKHWRDLWPALLPLAGLWTAGLAIGPIFGARMREAAVSQGYSNLPVMAWDNRWIWIPLVFGTVVSVLILALVQRPRSAIRRILLLAGMTAELASFGWYSEWRFVSPKDSATRPSILAEKCRDKLRTSGGRYLWVERWGRYAETMPPDVNVSWRIPAVSKYGPLMPSRYSDLLELQSNGRMTGQWWDPLNRSIDLVGMRLVTFPTDTHGIRNYRGVPFPNDDLALSAGHGCGATSDSGRILIGSPRIASRIAVVSLMGCSTGYTQGTPMLEMRLRAPDGRQSILDLRAGIDTAEWAATCPDVVPTMHHRPAEVFARFPAQRDQGVCQEQRYVTFLDLPKTMPVQEVDYRWLPQGPGVVQILKLVLLDGNAPARAVRTEDIWTGDRSRWKEFARSGGVAVYENLRACPRVWIVPETVSLAPDEIKRAIQTSKLPDGGVYDPAGMALIEEPLGLREPPDPDVKAWVVDDRHTTLDIQTHNRMPAFLVLGDLYYPGWKATVNGRPTRIFETNYIQRGVLVPAGRNFVRFEFHPASLYAGLGVSGAGLLLAIAAGIGAYRKRWL